MDKKKVGRPSKLTPEVKERLTDALRKGAYKDDACAYAGISKATFYHWLELGELRSKGEYKEFLDAVNTANSEGIHSKLKTIEIASDKGDWRAAAWWLEHKEPTKYGNREYVDVTKHGDTDIGKFIIADKELSELWTTTLKRAKFKRSGTNKSTRASDSD